jgi:1-acyl-sn-glycerol-3-phosphate acyltransferase
MAQSVKPALSGLASLRENCANPPTPSVSPLWMRWFAAYAERYVRKHFHSVRLLNAPSPVSTHPLVIYLNHASWWDPMICLVLRNRFFAQRTSFAPIDAAALEKYRFFAKLGFFPVEQNSMRGTVAFLESATRVLSRHDAALWLTPQGRFTDVRERPVTFRSGLAHLARRVPVATYVPLAIEYAFWEERLPEVCVNFGEPLVIRREEANEFGAEYLKQRLEQRLEAAQHELAKAVVPRDPARLRVLSKTESGVGGVYDAWRRAKALLTGQHVALEHGSK